MKIQYLMCIACAAWLECVISIMLIKHNVNFSDGGQNV